MLTPSCFERSIRAACRLLGRRARTWVEAYEKVSTGYAACAFIEDVGDGTESPRGRSVRELHDRLCQIGRNLPLA